MINPNIIFFFIFLLVSILFGVNSFFILYHLIRFGIGTRPKQTAFVFFIGSLFLFILLTVTYFNIDINKIMAENSASSSRSSITMPRP